MITLFVRRLTYVNFATSLFLHASRFDSTPIFFGMTLLVSSYVDELCRRTHWSSEESSLSETQARRQMAPVEIIYAHPTLCMRFQASKAEEAGIDRLGARDP